jgi:hypothetical protein
MGEVGCVGRALARVWAGVCGCTVEYGGHTLVWLNPKLMSKICVCVKLTLSAQSLTCQSNYIGVTNISTHTVRITIQI